MHNLLVFSQGPLNFQLPRPMKFEHNAGENSHSDHIKQKVYKLVKKTKTCKPKKLVLLQWW